MPCRSAAVRTFRSMAPYPIYRRPRFSPRLQAFPAFDHRTYVQVLDAYYINTIGISLWPAATPHNPARWRYARCMTPADVSSCGSYWSVCCGAISCGASYRSMFGSCGMIPPCHDKRMKHRCRQSCIPLSGLLCPCLCRPPHPCAAVPAPVPHT